MAGWGIFRLSAALVKLRYSHTAKKLSILKSNIKSSLTIITKIYNIVNNYNFTL